MKTQFLNTSEDVKWLKETHLKHIKLYLDFNSFIIKGNKDCPKSVELYERQEARFNDLPLVTFIQNEDGELEDLKLIKQKFAPSEFNPDGHILSSELDSWIWAFRKNIPGLTEEEKELLLTYCVMKKEAMEQRVDGDIKVALETENKLEEIYQNIPPPWRW